MTLRVHPGRDGHTILYDDAGDGDGYRQGECSRIAVTWDDATRTLRLGARQGSFPGMPNRIAFALELPGGHAGPTVDYRGGSLEVAL
jgi:alpha-D-xyloside xylohydrolase